MPGPGFLDLPVRSAKPRRTGITHVLDRGIPLAQAADLLEQNGCYVDVWKFGWGIAYLDPQLAAKLDLLARHRVLASPGGTLLEIAWAQGRAARVPRLGRRRGFPCVEVSAGTVPMEDAAKRDLIAAAAERFIVLAEVGSKDAAVRADAGAVGAGRGRRPGGGRDLDPGRGPGQRHGRHLRSRPERSARTWSTPWPRRPARTAWSSRRPARTSRPGSSAGSART